MPVTHLYRASTASLGLAFRVPGWSDAVFDISLFGTSYTPPRDLMSLPEVAADFMTFLANDDYSQVWGGEGDQYWEIMVADDGRLGVRMLGDYQPTVNTNEAWDALFGSTAWSTSPAVGGLGTIAVQVDTYGWDRWPSSPGGQAPAGAWSMAGAVRHAPRRPSVGANLDVGQSTLVREALRHTPQSPLVVSVLNPGGDWLPVHVGQIGWQDEGDAYQRLELEVLG